LGLRCLPGVCKPKTNQTKHNFGKIRSKSPVLIAKSTRMWQQAV